jgi:hypothetical protein
MVERARRGIIVYLVLARKQKESMPMLVGFLFLFLLFHLGLQLTGAAITIQGGPS